MLFMRKRILSLRHYKMVKAVVLGAFVVMLIAGLALVSAEPAYAAGKWCSKNATFAGQRGWQPGVYDPNLVVEFPVNLNRQIGEGKIYIYYQGSWIYLASHGYYPGYGHRFGVSTRWALQNPLWNTPSRWRVNYWSYTGVC